MNERVFTIMQIGAKDSLERKRADEIYNFIVVPAVAGVGLEAYRADLDYSPGAITPKFLSELLSARLVIADLTGRNPNVFYELGIAHSFARPLISIADSTSSLPFDTKDERIIELGEYSSSGLTYTQGEQAKTSLQESLKIVLADGYVPPSPLRELAANASVDRLAPENPIAAELAQVREYLEEMRYLLRSRDNSRDSRNFIREILVSNERMQAELASVRAMQAELVSLVSASRTVSAQRRMAPKIDKMRSADSAVKFLRDHGIAFETVDMDRDGDLILHIKDWDNGKDDLRGILAFSAREAGIAIRVSGPHFEQEEIFAPSRDDI
jgi:hypothetical protein